MEMDDATRWEWRADDDESEGMESPTKRRRQHSDGEGDMASNHTFPWEMEGDYSRQEVENGGDDGNEDDGEGLGLMEAFESFNLRAEKRVHELLLATDAKLFDLESHSSEESNAPPPQTPSYVLMSDQYRQSRPPQFKHWQQCFPYLQITGKSSFDEAPDEHIQIRPAPAASESSSRLLVEIQGDDEAKMAVVGKKMQLLVDLSDPPQEELIMADGEMEEVLEDDSTGPVIDGYDDADEDERRPPTGALACPSPRTSRANEAVDRITLRRQQLDLKTTRERHEEAVRLQTAAEIAALEEKRRREDLAEQERVRYELAVAQAIEEERVREEARREELLRQQREENDEEEIKIRTLAYTHTREWHQPNKKCFSHRGRKMTYLKPVLKAQQEGEQVEQTQGEGGSERSCDEPRARVYAPTKPPPSEASAAPRRGRRRKSSPSQLDLENAKSPAISPQPSPTLWTSSSRPSSGQEVGKALTTENKRTQLPLLPKVSSSRKQPQAQDKAQGSRRQSQGKKRGWHDDDGKRSPPPASPSSSLLKAQSATVAAPSRVYVISPYRIPPAILKTELKRDAVATGRQRRQPRKAPSEVDSEQHD